MTHQTPIERAARELSSLSTGRVCAPSDPDIRWEGWVPDAKAAFESIDTNELADVLVRDLTYSTGLDSESNDSIARHQAQAVIEWLTTGEKLGGPERQLGPTRIERNQQ